MEEPDTHVDTSNRRPDDADLALVRIICAPVSERAERWDEWVVGADFEQLSPEAYGVLAELYKAVEPLNLVHPWIARLRGVFRRTWTTNQVHRATFDSIADALTGAGINLLRPADHEIAAVLPEPAAHQLRPPRVVVPWANGPHALAVLTAVGWHVAEPPPRSARARLTRTRWALATPEGATAELATTYNPQLSGEQRDREVFRRAGPRAGQLFAAHPVDIACNALTDQLDVPGSIRWIPGAVAVLDAFDGHIDLRQILDRRAASRVLTAVVPRLEVLVTEGFSARAAAHLRVAQELAAAHPLASRPRERAVDWTRRQAALATRTPTTARRVIARHGGLPGLVAALRG